MIKINKYKKEKSLCFLLLSHSKLNSQLSFVHIVIKSVNNIHFITSNILNNVARVETHSCGTKYQATKVCNCSLSYIVLS